jgi:hypothetical protein
VACHAAAAQGRGDIKHRMEMVNHAAKESELEEDDVLRTHNCDRTKPLNALRPPHANVALQNLAMRMR